MFKKDVREEVAFELLIQKMGGICTILIRGALSISKPKDDLKLAMSILFIEKPSKHFHTL